MKRIGKSFTGVISGLLLGAGAATAQDATSVEEIVVTGSGASAITTFSIVFVRDSASSAVANQAVENMKLTRPIVFPPSVQSTDAFYLLLIFCNFSRHYFYITQNILVKDSSIVLKSVAIYQKIK